MKMAKVKMAHTLKALSCLVIKNPLEIQLGRNKARGHLRRRPQQRTRKRKRSRIRRQMLKMRQK